MNDFMNKKEREAHQDKIHKEFNENIESAAKLMSEQEIPTENRKAWKGGDIYEG